MISEKELAQGSQAALFPGPVSQGQALPGTELRLLTKPVSWCARVRLAKSKLVVILRCFLGITVIRMLLERRLLLMGGFGLVIWVLLIVLG